jgi:DNA invertase Pin-like site-specific DNA recombinase
MKVNVDKHKVIQVAKEKGVYKGRPLLYSPNAKDPQKRIIYHRVVEMLEEGKAISKIAKEVNITRQTVYRIKMVRDYLDKWIVNANEIFSQRPKLYVIHLL